MYKKETYTKTTLDGSTETIEKIETNPSGLLEFCAAIIAITLSILSVTIILQSLNHASSTRRLDLPIHQSQKPM